MRRLKFLRFCFFLIYGSFPRVSKQAFPNLRAPAPRWIHAPPIATTPFWSGRGESNSRYRTPSAMCYHYTTPRLKILSNKLYLICNFLTIYHINSLNMNNQHYDDTNHRSKIIYASSFQISITKKY